MLGKLLKYDLKWLYKVLIVFYILALIFSLIGRGFNSIENSVLFNILAQISFGIAVSMMISSLINCLMRSWVRFIYNTYKDESYLTHTLPVKKNTIYLSKVLTSIICMLTTTIIIGVCLFICYYSEANIEAVKSMLELAADTYNTTVINLLLIIFVVLFLELVFIVLVGYDGIIIGHRFNKNKMLKSILIGLGLYIATNALTLGFVAIYGLINPDIMNLINTTKNVDIGTVKSVMYIAIVIYIIYNVIYYILGKKELEKGVNVD